MNTIRFERDERGVARLNFNRPEVRNAVNGEMIDEISSVIQNFDESIRVLVLSGEGTAFCAGADVRWLAGAGAGSGSHKTFASLLETFNNFRVPVVGRIHGPAMAGATGIVACCDYVVAAESSLFGFPEVTMGLVPAIVSPYVVRKTGYGFARAMFMTGTRFGPVRAYEAGLVNLVVPDDELDEAVSEVVEALLAAAPEALLKARALAGEVNAKTPSEVADYTLKMFAEGHQSAEAAEGIAAFLEKRLPKWHPDSK